MSIAVAEEQPSSLLEQFQIAVAADLSALSLLHRQEVDAALLGDLRTADFPQSLGLHLRSQKGQDALAMMTQAITELSVPLESAILDELAVDFANIDLTHGCRAAPNESVWCDEEQLERQLPMFEISQIYRQHGLAAADRQTMPDDHLSLQLEFIAYLCEQAQDAADLQKIADFMDAPVLLWIDKFAHCVSSRSATLFYAGLAALSASYLDELRDDLAHITGKSRPSLTETTPSQAAAQEMPLQYIPGVAPSW